MPATTTRVSAADRKAARGKLQGCDLGRTLAIRTKSAISGDVALFDAAGERLRELRRDGSPGVLFKNSTHEVKAAATRPRVKRFVITTDVVDRDGDVVIPSGVEIDEYMGNPVFLWAHQFHLPPLGKCVGMGVLGDVQKPGAAIWADVEFAEDEFADRIFKLYDGNFLNAVSIGFKTLRVGPPDSSIYMARPDSANQCKRVIYRCKLLEISAVPIPSNYQALQVAVTKGLCSPDFLKEIDMPQDEAKSVNPARRLVDWVGKSLNWSAERIESLTLKEVEDLGHIIPPIDEAKSGEGEAESKEMPTQTASGDGICPKCGMSKMDCKCMGSKEGEAETPAAEAPATEAKSAPAPAPVPVEVKTPQEYADLVLKSLATSGAIEKAVAGIVEAVGSSLQEAVDRAKGKV